MTAPDWAALVQQTRDRIDQAEKMALAATPAPWVAHQYAVYAPRELWDEGGGQQAIAQMRMPYRAHRLQANADHIASWGSPDVALRMAAWARDVLYRHHEIADFEVCHHCTLSDVSVSWPCADVKAVLRAWVPDLLTAAGVES